MAKPKLPSKTLIKQRLTELKKAEKEQERVMAEVAKRPKRTPEQLEEDKARGYRTLFDPKAKITPVPNPLPEAPHSVQKEYFNYIEKRKGRTETGKDLQNWITENRPEFPYGKLKDTDPKTGKKKWMPVQGPANWTTFWPDFQSIGDDFRDPIEDNKQLLQTKMDELNASQQKLKNIRFVKLLGEGAFGKVWKVKATKVTLQTEGVPKPVNVEERVGLACKVLRLNQFKVNQYDQNDPDAFDEFVNYELQTTIFADLRTLRYLKHKNICEMVDTISIPDTVTGFPYAAFCFFMELCEGDLFKIIKRNQPRYLLSEDQCKDWFRQLVEAVQYLHKNNVVHFDIKPQNILYKQIPNSQQRTYKLCDFGLAMAFKSVKNQRIIYRSTDRCLGTENFLAPELENVHSKKPFAAKPCDIYSLAATLVFALFGYKFLPKLLKISKSAQIGIHMLVPNKRNPNVSDEVKSLIIDMIRKNPKTRLTIDAVFAHNWLN